MDVINNYDVYFGNVAGSILRFQPKKSVLVPIRAYNPLKAAVSSLSWGRTDTEILIGYDNGNLGYFNTITQTYQCATIVNDCAIVNMIPLDDVTILVGCEDGSAHTLTSGVYKEFIKATPSHLSTFRLRKMVGNAFDKNKFALGGDETDVRVYDVSTQQVIFQAKGDPHDELQIPAPISVNGITFLHGKPDLATVTLDGQIRIYDTRAQRRPVKSVKNELANSIFTCITATDKMNQLLVGGNTGHVQLMDYRGKLKSVKTFKGFMGSVVDVCCDYNNPILFSCSLDRHFRVHNLDTLHLVYEEYMKTRMTRMLMRPKSSNPVQSTSDDETEEQNFPKKQRTC